MFAADLPPATAQTEYLQIELVAAERAVASGRSHWLGLRLQHAPGWHTYWTNPGDSGLATKTRWTLPAGVSVGAMQWPAPSRHPLGDLHNFGYDGEIFLPIELKLDPALRSERLRVSVDVSWLVCEEACIPGKASLGLELPLDAAGPDAATAASGPHAAALQRALQQVPAARDWPLSLRSTDSGFELELSGTTELGAIPELFPVQAQVFSNAPPVHQGEAQGHRWTIARSDYYVAMPEPFEVVVKDPSSNLSYVLTARSLSPQP